MTLDGRCGLLSEVVELESEIVGDTIHVTQTNVKAVELSGADLVVGKGSMVAVGNPFLVRQPSSC